MNRTSIDQDAPTSSGSHRGSGNSDTGNNRDQDRNKGQRRTDEATARDVRGYIKNRKHRLTEADREALKGKGKNPDQIEDDLIMAWEDIQEHANKLATAFVDKYSDNTPYTRILDYANKYRLKANIGDVEWTEIRRLIDLKLKGYQTDKTFNITNIARALGYNQTGNTLNLNIEDKDYKYIDDILKRHAETKTTHEQLTMLTNLYTDCSLMAISGEYNRERHSTMQYIHPLIAALYLPKIPLIEQQTLYTNFGLIVKAAKDNKTVTGPYNNMLLFNISNDPSDVVCSGDSTIADISKRFEVQTKLWDAVMALRNGVYFTPAAAALTRALDGCRVDGIDNPELSYSQDEGDMMRRFLSIFSLRPTLISTSVPATLKIASPFDRMVMAPKITQTSMVMLRLSPYAPNQPVDVSDALKSRSFINVNGVLTERIQQVHSSYDLLTVYVARRYQNTVLSQYSQPFSFTALPVATAGLEQLIDRPVSVGNHLQLQDGSSFKLRSAVAVEQTVLPGSTSKVICGNSAVIVKQPDLVNGVAQSAYLYYNPTLSRFRIRGNNGFEQINPITALPYDGDANSDSYLNIVSTRATVLIYTRDQ